MKITCDSCGSKYTIADAKVQGRKVKVRCKNCKAMILVDGAGSTGSDDGADDSGDADMAIDVQAEAPKSEGGKKNLWSVNLTDDDSRDMSTAELIAGWKSGLVTTDAYVWKDGMGDWKPILEVPELKQKLLAAKPLKDDGVVSSARPPGAKLPAARSGDDLFGGINLAGGVDEPAATPALSASDDKKPTGARNESSVLFSLDSLGKGPAPAATKKADANDVFGGLGGGGGLAANVDLLMAPAKDPPPAPAGARIAAPAAAPEKSKSSVVIAAILAVAAVVVVGLYFTLGSSGDDAEAEALKAKTAELERQAKAREEEMRRFQDQMMAELKKAREEAAQRGEDPEAAARKKQAELEAAKKAEDEAKKAAEAGGATKPAAGTTSSSTTSKPSTGSTTSTPAPAAAAPAASGGAEFDRGAAKAALDAASANAATCAQPGGPTGSGKVEVTFAPSGRVTSANVIAGPFGGTPVGGCVASKFRAARVPKFSGDPVTVAKSFRIN